LVGLGKAQGLVFDLCFYRAEALENFCKKIWNLGNRGGYYDTPLYCPLSSVQQGSSLTAPRVTAEKKGKISVIKGLSPVFLYLANKVLHFSLKSAIVVFEKLQK
ncbi:hypothetical protein, partial [Enterococcus sp. DIV2381]